MSRRPWSRRGTRCAAARCGQRGGVPRQLLGFWLVFPANYHGPSSHTLQQPFNCNLLPGFPLTDRTHRTEPTNQPTLPCLPAGGGSGPRAAGRQRHPVRVPGGQGLCRHGGVLQVGAMGGRQGVLYTRFGKGVLGTLGWPYYHGTSPLLGSLLSSLPGAALSVYKQCLRPPHPPTYTHSPQPAATRARMRSTRWWQAAVLRVSRHSLGRRIPCICRGPAVLSSDF